MRTVAITLAALWPCLLVACAAETDDSVEGSRAELHGGDWCDRVFELEHQIDVGEGVRLHVAEKVSVRSFAAWPRRAIVLLPPTLATNDIYRADVAGDRSYDAMERLALAGYIVLAPTYEGYGESSQPEDGSTVTAERLLWQIGELVEWIRVHRGAPQVDLMGMSIGSSLAVALGGELSPIDPDHVGRIVLTSHVYESVTPFFEAVFFSPEIRALLESAPDGYILTEPFNYFALLDHVEPEVLDWASLALPGRYATGPTLEGFDLPVFEASYGRAPALQVWGDEDPVTPLSDAEQFQAEYGGPSELHVVAGGGHSLVLEPVRDELWSEVLAFLDEGRHPVPTLGCPE